MLTFATVLSYKTFMYICLRNFIHKSDNPQGIEYLYHYLIILKKK
jgi:hypothetical protein